MVALAKQKLPAGEFRVGGIDSPPFADASFDVVIACDCLFFATDVVTAVRELCRVCKDDGTVGLLVWEPPEKSDYSRLIATLQAVLPSQPRFSPLALSKEGVLEGLVSNAGLNVREVKSVQTDYFFTNFEVFWGVFKRLGPNQPMIQSVEEEVIRHAAYSGAGPSIKPNWEVLFKNAYRVVTPNKL